MEEIRSPQDIFIEDLSKEISSWLSAGEHIILVINLNKDMRNGKYADKLKQLGLYELITDFYKEEDIQSTYNRGQLSIDRLFLSHSIIITSGSYLPFSKVPSDHRAL